MSIVSKIVGLLFGCIGLLLCYAEYLVFTTVSAIAAWLGVIIGITGASTTGITILLCIPILGVIIGIGSLICIAFYLAISFIVDK